MLVDAIAANRRPRDIITRDAIENAIALVMATGGSTNAVLHYLAIASAAEVPWTIDDFERIRRRTPVLCDLKPSGRYVAVDFRDAGGVPQVLKMLLDKGLVDGDCMTITGGALGEELERVPAAPRADQQVIRPFDQPMYAQGHLAILRGNLAPEGCVAKITGLKNPSITGPARVFDSEAATMEAIMARAIKPGDVVVIRYEGPKGGPGMQEMLAPTSALIGQGLGESIGPHHRRPLLGRHVGHGRRARRAGSLRRRTDRADRGRRLDHHRRASTADPAQRRRRDARASAARAGSRLRRATRAACSASTCGSCRPRASARSPTRRNDARPRGGARRRRARLRDGLRHRRRRAPRPTRCTSRSCAPPAASCSSTPTSNRRAPASTATRKAGSRSSTRATCRTRSSSTATVRHSGAASLRIDNVGPEPFGATYQRVDARPYRGQRLRWSAWLRTEDARGSMTGGGAVLLIQAMQSGAPLAWNHMTDAPVRGTTPWQQLSIELDVPAAAEEIEVGAMLHGPGRLWLDDVVLEALPRT